MKVFSELILPLFGIILLVACQPAQSESLMPQPSLAESANASVPALPVLDTAQIAHGKTVYEQHCAACHGLNLQGEAEWKTQNEDGSFKAPPHNADGHTWHHADSELIEAIRLGGTRFEGMDIGGTSPMPAYAEVLSDEEMTAVLTYIKSTWPEDIRQLQWEVTLMRSQQ